MSSKTTNTMLGFTLFELLLTLAVLVIIAGISVPSFAPIVERQRIEALMQRLESDLALARTTAMMRRQTVQICPRDAAGNCQPGLDWSGGWLVLVEDARHLSENGVSENGERLWAQPALAASGPSLALHANRPLLRYRHDGSSAGSNLTLDLCLRGQVVMQQIVNNSGRARRHHPEGELACPR